MNTEISKNGRVDSDKGQDRAKNITVTVNGRALEISARKQELTYLEVVQLAFPGEQPTDRVAFTVSYSLQNGKEGSLVEGQSVKAEEGAIFNVGKTDAS